MQVRAFRESRVATDTIVALDIPGIGRYHRFELVWLYGSYSAVSNAFWGVWLAHTLLYTRNNWKQGWKCLSL